MALNQIFNYEDLIYFSTPEFQDKHLILHNRNRQKLFSMCSERLGLNGNYATHKRKFHISLDSYYYKIVYDACYGMAARLLSSLLDYGYFQSGHSVAETNTLVVSVQERILIHITKSWLPDYGMPDYALELYIEQKRTVDELFNHFSLDEDAKIAHYISS